jgi:hypothetical protein
MKIILRLEGWEKEIEVSFTVGSLRFIEVPVDHLFSFTPSDINILFTYHGEIKNDCKVFVCSGNICL